MRRGIGARISSDRGVDMDDDDYSSILKNKLNRARGGFDLFDDKKQIELYVFESFCSLIGWPDSLEYTHSESPDFVLFLQEKKIGIELTEITNKNSIVKKQNARLKYNRTEGSLSLPPLTVIWSPILFQETICSLIERKDDCKKIYKNNMHFDEYVVILHTSELMITDDFVNNSISNFFLRTKSIDKVYLLVYPHSLYSIKIERS